MCICVQTEEGGSVEARELGAVLAYLQREVPSLVALPPNELRSLVLQVILNVTYIEICYVNFYRMPKQQFWSSACLIAGTIFLFLRAFAHHVLNRIF